MSQEKSKTMPMQMFFLGGRGGERGVLWDLCTQIIQAVRCLSLWETCLNALLRMRMETDQADRYKQQHEAAGFRKHIDFSNSPYKSLPAVF